MQKEICSISTAVLAIIITILLSSLPESEGLQCYNCRGITNYDPNECFVPVPGKTVQQECQKGEVCEKRVTMVDRLQDVIDRGCSSNCASRAFIWTDEFQVYCCNNGDNCNGAQSTTRLTHLWTACALSSIVYVFTQWRYLLAA